MPIIEWDTGVYMILNTFNGKRYVGSAAKSFSERKKQHWDGLRLGKHFNRYLQNAWNKYGAAAFVFYILERCEPESCVEQEQHWLDCLHAADQKHGYNLSPTAGSTLGVVHSIQARQNMSLAQLGKPSSPEAVLARTASLRKAYQNPKLLQQVTAINRCRIAAESPEQRKYRTRGIHRGELLVRHRYRIKKSKQWFRHSEETKRKISEVQRGKTLTEEHKRRIGESLVGRICSEETKAKLSVVKKLRCADPAFRAKMAEIVRQRHAEEKRLGIVRRCRVSSVKS